ncbi:MAG: 3-hydroxyacyl-CoA dehydrogenase family protein [Clostridia bacterium]
MKNRTSREIKKIAVIGAGTMGPGIIQAFACGGYDVHVWEPVESNREKARARIRAGLELAASQESIRASQIDEINKSISFAGSLQEAAADAQFIMEAIVENAAVKESFYRELLAYVEEETIIASNTSALNIFEVVPAEIRRQMLIVHWYAPAQLIPLVEVIKSEEAPQWMADQTLTLLKTCGKAPVQMKKFIQGYIVNRLQQCLNREIFFLLDHDYCTAEDIDFAAKMSFIPRAMVLGLCKKIDFGGVDLTIDNFRNHSYQMPPDVELPKTLEAMEQKKQFGIKTGKGFYDYSGVDIEEILKKRDEQLAEAYHLAVRFMEDPV